MTVHDFQATAISGETVPLSAYRGRVLLIVNVASKCGFTPQYKGLQDLHSRFEPDGFAVLGFPCNQFGGQEPGADSEIRGFCDIQYGVTFPMFAKIEVNGPKAHPLYQFLKNEKRGVLGLRRIQWNFTKFLVDRQGRPVKRYAPQTTPERMAEDVRNALLKGGQK